MVNPETIRRRLNKLDDYLDVDHQIVYDVLENNLDDLRALQSAFARFL